MSVFLFSLKSFFFFFFFFFYPPFEIVCGAPSHQNTDFPKANRTFHKRTDEKIKLKVFPSSIFIPSMRRKDVDPGLIWPPLISHLRKVFAERKQRAWISEAW